MQKSAILLLASVATLLAACSGTSTEPGLVTTAQGVTRGVPSRLDGVTMWLGLPYAAPPTGELRWKAPRPAAGWDSIRVADAFGNRCIQTNAFADMVWNSGAESEDCLYLNVWAPETAAGLPVMFWIHGGGYFAGSADENRHDGSSLASRGVVLVTVNYRLGAMGFFAHPDLTEESGTGASGNYG